MTTNAPRWLADLAALVNPTNAERTAAAYVGMVEMMGDVPERVWRSRKALEHVATAEYETKVPNLRDIRSQIWKWVRENPDPTKALPGTGGSSTARESTTPYIPPPRAPKPEKVDTGALRKAPDVRPSYLSPQQLLAAYKRDLATAASPMAARALQARIDHLSKQWEPKE